MFFQLFASEVGNVHWALQYKEKFKLGYLHTWPITAWRCEERLGDGFGKLLKLSDSKVLGDGISKAIWPSGLTFCSTGKMESS